MAGSPDGLPQLIDHAGFQPNLLANLNPTTSNCLSKLRKNVWMTQRRYAHAILLGCQVFGLPGGRIAAKRFFGVRGPPSASVASRPAWFLRRFHASSGGCRCCVTISMAQG